MSSHQFNDGYFHNDDDDSALPQRPQPCAPCFRRALSCSALLRENGVKVHFDVADVSVDRYGQVDGER